MGHGSRHACRWLAEQDPVEASPWSGPLNPASAPPAPASFCSPSWVFQKHMRIRGCVASSRGILCFTVRNGGFVPGAELLRPSGISQVRGVIEVSLVVLK